VGQKRFAVACNGTLFATLIFGIKPHPDVGKRGVSLGQCAASFNDERKIRVNRMPFALSLDGPVKATPGCRKTVSARGKKILFKMPDARVQAAPTRVNVIEAHECWPIGSWPRCTQLIRESRFSGTAWTVNQYHGGGWCASDGREHNVSEMRLGKPTPDIRGI
jgi:hypothetical protein